MEFNVNTTAYCLPDSNLPAGMGLTLLPSRRLKLPIAFPTLLPAGTGLTLLNSRRLKLPQVIVNK